MKFCNQCGTLYSLKKLENEGGKPELVYECKRCGHQEQRGDTSSSIYSTEIGTDFMTHQVSTNPYIIRDPTLPRLSNVKCINKRCVTNHNPETWILSNANLVPADSWDDHPCTRSEVTPDQITQYGELHIGDHTLIVENQEYLDEHHVQLLIPDEGTDLAEIEFENDGDPEDTPLLGKLMREIISIKYDDVDMKYMYVCSTCGSSWKNVAD